MTAIKRCCALALAVLMILTALPVTAFAQAAEQEVNASLQETTVSGIANDIARQVLRSGQKNGEKIQMENTAKLDDSDEVEIIVVVNDSVADPDSRAQVNALLRTQKSALAQINRAIDGQVEPQRQYTTLLNGFSATVTYGQYKAIRNLDCVQSAFISPTFELLPDTANSNRMIGGGIYNTTGFTGEGMLVAILDTGVDMGHEIFKTAPKSPSLTREKLQSMLETYDFQVESIVKGISVSDLYYSAKIPFQFDYGDRDKDGMPGDKGSHGTHVASTAAGNTGVNEAAMGVAPQAQIINMNVFKSTGGASYADILAALEDCILLGVDVANLSLGSDCGYIDYDSEDAFTKSLLDVFERTGESGVSLAVAAGNAYNAAYGDAFGGKALASNPDYGLVSEPSTYGESLSVAAVSNGMVKGPYVTVGGKNLAYQDSATISEDENAKPFRSLSAQGSIEYVVVPNYGAEEDYAGLDLTGKIALVQRGGGMYYEQKERNAANAGAIGMLVYNNVPGMLYMSITDWKIPCAFISQAAGEYMKQQETKTLSVASADALVESPTYGMADFSSWGATPELTLKPELTAPGAGIYAAVPGGYESMDGTSMASPHAAGGMAIVQQALKARDNSMTGAQRKHMTDTLLMSTANEGGSVAPAGQTRYAPGASAEITFTPDPGYQLASVKVNGRTVDVTDGAYTLVMDQSYAVSAAFEKIPDVPVVMFQNDFEDVAGDSFPFHGWTVKVQDTSSTWKQYTYYNWKNEGNDSKHAYISNDWKGAQDEYLISPVVDLSGTRDGVLTFDFAYGEYGIKNKTFTATVEASTDGGKTWNAIWNFQDSYTGQQASNYIISGSAEVPVPAEYNVDGVQFAFRYVHPNEDTTGQLAIDNVKLMAVEDGPVAQKYTITATAGEGGSITPAGAVSVKEGASQTFAIAAQEGYAIADVLVDGQSVGAVDSYTFENVTANHTIAALFTKTASDVQFDNDFESENFPGHGWTVKGTRTDNPYTWYKGTNTKLNSTKQARIDMDYYEDPWGGGWSVGGIRKPLLPMAGGSDKLQDEYLISPVVNLTGKTPTLSFDYLLFKSVIGNYCSVTVEATTDGGQTWTTIWTAADLEPVSGYWFMGTANVAVPAAFCTDNAQFAFHFYKKANRGYDDTDAMFAIDNVTMTYGVTDPCADGHTLTAVAEVPATCEETGVKAHWVCSVCSKLFSDAEGKNETTLEALTIGVLGHDYGEAAWTWTGYESAKATFTCSRDASHVEEVTAAVTSEITTPASCESTGVRTYTATVTFQGQTYTDTKTETLPAAGHAWGEPVWTWTGCSAAEASFACARDAGHVKVLPASITSEVTTQPGCSTEGVRTYTATVTLEGKNYTDTRTETLPSLGHKTQLVGAKAATCTEDGYTGDEVCTVCGETVKKGEVIPAPGHKTQLVGAKAATCTEDGYTGDEVCTVCGETVKKGEVIPAPGHKTQLVGAKAATCTEDGYTGDEVCTVCQEVVKKGEVIPATGHDYKDGKCTNCGETDPNYKPAEPENPGVKTGDEAHTALWLAAASVSLLAAAALLLGKKKHLN